MLRATGQRRNTLYARRVRTMALIAIGNLRFTMTQPCADRRGSCWRGSGEASSLAGRAPQSLAPATRASRLAGCREFLVAGLPRSSGVVIRRAGTSGRRFRRLAPGPDCRPSVSEEEALVLPSCRHRRGQGGLRLLGRKTTVELTARGTLFAPDPAATPRGSSPHLFVRPRSPACLVMLDTNTTGSAINARSLPT